MGPAFSAASPAASLPLSAEPLLIAAPTIRWSLTISTTTTTLAPSTSLTISSQPMVSLSQTLTTHSRASRWSSPLGSTTPKCLRLLLAWACTCLFNKICPLRMFTTPIRLQLRLRLHLPTPALILTCRLLTKTNRGNEKPFIKQSYLINLRMQKPLFFQFLRHFKTIEL